MISFMNKKSHTQKDHSYVKSRKFTLCAPIQGARAHAPSISGSCELCVNNAHNNIIYSKTPTFIRPVNKFDFNLHVRLIFSRRFIINLLKLNCVLTFSDDKK